jgi:hypothetical protein
MGPGSFSLFMTFIKDPESGKQSVTLTLLLVGFAVCTLKLLFGGTAIGPLTLSPFSGGDYAAAVGALGALYWARRNAATASSGKPDA